MPLKFVRECVRPAIDEGAITKQNHLILLGRERCDRGVGETQVKTAFLQFVKIRIDRGSEDRTSKWIGDSSGILVLPVDREREPDKFCVHTQHRQLKEALVSEWDNSIYLRPLRTVNWKR